jgi:hypothetical protein
MEASVVPEHRSITRIRAPGVRLVGSDPFANCHDAFQVSKIVPPELFCKSRICIAPDKMFEDPAGENEVFPVRPNAAYAPKPKLIWILPLIE